MLLLLITYRRSLNIPPKAAAVNQLGGWENVVDKLQIFLCCELCGELAVFRAVCFFHCIRDLLLLIFSFHVNPRALCVIKNAYRRRKKFNKGKRWNLGLVGAEVHSRFLSIGEIIFKAWNSLASFLCCIIQTYAKDPRALLTFFPPTSLLFSLCLIMKKSGILALFLLWVYTHHSFSFHLLLLARVQWRHGKVPKGNWKIQKFYSFFGIAWAWAGKFEFELEISSFFFRALYAAQKDNSGAESIASQTTTVGGRVGKSLELFAQQCSFLHDSAMLWAERQQQRVEGRVEKNW